MSVSPNYPASSLYCNETVNDVIHSDALLCDHISFSISPTISQFEDESSVVNMFDSELDQMPGFDLVRQLGNFDELVTARHDAINWMFKVHAYYNFMPKTAYLSVNYLDRFLASHALSQGKRWPWQLLSVACLSLAAKMEETKVPLLLDLQVLEPKFMFKPKTVQRMELLVMASLRWRLRAITPFDFLDHFIAKLQSFNTQFDQFSCIFSRVSDLILITCQLIDFLEYTPSTIAAAAVQWATGQNVNDHKSINFHERVSNKMVKRCHKLFKDHLIKVSQPACNKQQLSEPTPLGMLY
uniref:Putative cyclin-D4-1 n=1 Tax=Davidia involucrata TaxID=16924 RepID=A0A5B7B1X7_DAVIN